jgi:Holliday junction resolvasome RuvABC ATP-dependent DNA helicase subunit
MKNDTIIAKVAMGQGKKGQSVRAINTVNNEDITSEITYMTLSKAYKAGMWLSNESGKWRQIDPVDGAKKAKSTPTAKVVEAAKNEAETVMSFLTTCVEKRPISLFCEDLTWKFICRSVMRGRNILLTGPTGCGKSQTAFAVAKAMDRELFYINLGATQDPRGTLIGNTHFSKDAGTFFNESAFVKAISTPNTIILLDEVSRAHPEAWNILMTVLDPNQRYLRMDEAVNTPTVKVADGVSFIGTANIGSEYTAVRVMDRALLDRFTIAEIPFLKPEEETSLMMQIYPSMDIEIAKNLAEIAGQTRAEIRSDNARIQTPISTRSVMEMAGLMTDGFTLTECAEVSIYPLYSQDGGLQSERTFVKQLVQKYVNDGTADNLMGADNNQPAF